MRLALRRLTSSPLAFPFVLTALLLAPTRAGAAISYRDFALPTGTNPQALVSADCDGDGRPDLVAANFGDDTVTVFRNLGGSFALARTVHTSPQPGGATCTDLNGDGRIDLAVSSFTAGTVTAYLADDAGDLSPSATVAVGQQPRSISAADFDRDGNADLLVVNARTSGLTILFGDGTGAFPFASTIRLPAGDGRNRPLSAAIGDYNHDGLPDVAVIGQGDPPLRILLGDGLGFAVDDTKLPVAVNPRAAAATDVDGDGLMDLAILSTDATLRLYRGNASRRFADPTSTILGPDARAIALADFDGDGLPDLAVAYAKSNVVQVSLAESPGRFRQSGRAVPAVVNANTALVPRAAGDELIALDRAARRITRLRLNDQSVLATTQLATLDSPPQTLVVTDFDGDGFSDVLVAVQGPTGPRLQTRRGTAAGTLEPPIDACAPSCGLTKAVLASAAADLDGDGHPDVVVTDVRGALIALLGNGTGGFREARNLGTVKPRSAFAVAPFQGDGAADLVVVPVRSTAALTLLANDGTGHFTARPLPGTERLRGPFLAADLDRNGFVDLIAGDRSRRAFTVLFNDGDGPRRPGSIVTLPGQLAGFAAADVDEDGWSDLLTFFRRRGTPSALYLASPGGVFDRGGSSVASDARASAAVADVNEDQHQDLVQCDGGSAASCTVAYGDGRGRFAATPPRDVAVETGAYVGRLARGAAAADFDGDGVVDVAGISKRDNRLVVVYRQADGTAATRLELATGSKPVAIATADLDADGRADLVVANEGSNDVSVYLARAGRTFSTLARTTLENATFKPTALAVGDLDGDRRPDLALASAASARVILLLNRGLGGLVRATTLPTGADPQAVALADVNGDGLVDVATANGGDDTVSLFVADGLGGYETRVFPSGGIHPTDATFADVDGDGTSDLLVVHETSRTLVTLLNDGAGDFPLADVTELPGRKRPWNLCTGDFDADGAPDVAVASLGTGDVTLLRGTGAVGWSGDVRVFSIGEDPRPLSCTDLDRDGLTDVLFVRRRTGRMDAILTGR